MTLGTVITGVLVAVTAIVFAAAALPKLSVAFTVIVSGPAVESVSDSVPNTLSTTKSELWIVTLFVPFPVIVPPKLLLIVSRPWVSVRVTVNVSGEPVLPVSDTLTPDIAVAPDNATVCGPGTAITGWAFTVTGTVCCVATLPKLSVAVSVRVSDAGPATGSLSFSTANVLSTSNRLPLIVSVLPPLLATDVAVPEATADSTPMVSEIVTVNDSGADVLPVSLTLMPDSGLVWPTPTVSLVGTLITGILFTATAMFFTGAVPPMLSLALTVMVSLGADASVSVSDASVVFTSVRDPAMVSLVPPLAEVTVAVPDAVAASTPFASFSTTVNVSPARAPGSATLMPPIAPVLLTPTVAFVGAAMVGPFTTVTGMFPGVALLPKLSEAVTAIGSDPVVPLLSDNVPSAASTALWEPLTTTLFDPLLVTKAPPGVPIVSTPAVSFNVTVKISPVTLPLSNTPPIGIAVVLPALMVWGPASDRNGSPFTVTAICCCAATAPKLSVAFSTIVSAAVLLSLSVSVPSAAFTWISVPLICSTSLPEPVTVAPLALPIDSAPAPSVSVTVNTSVGVALVSLRLTGPIASAWPTPITTDAGAAITGAAITEIATFAGPALPPLPPMLSIAVTTIVSADVLGSESVSVASVALTAANEPLMVKFVLAGLPTLAPPWLVALSSPFVSFSVTVKVSPAKAPVSEIETPVSEVTRPCDTVAEAGPATVSAPLTVTAIFCCVALAPLLSDALR